MQTSNLSHVTTASGIARSLATQPTAAVLVHWQLQDFPTRVAETLLKQSRNILWVVATTERGDIAEQALSKAGITVRRVKTEVQKSAVVDQVVVGEQPDAQVGGGRSLTKIQLLRMELKRKEQQAQARQRKAIEGGFPLPPVATITIVSIQRLCHSRPLEDIGNWTSPLVLFDHIGGINAGWLTLDSKAPEEGAPLKTKMRKHDSHPIPVFSSKGIPLVFLFRDEFEGALLRADFKRRGCTTTELSTKFIVPPKLRVSVVTTNLVTSKYSVGAFLSVVLCNPEAQVVGEALIGALTPDKLSMGTLRPLKKAVLKLSRQAETFVQVASLQTKLPHAELGNMRTRDFIRTAILAIDPTSRTPELAILCPGDMRAEVSRFVNVPATRLPNWSPRFFQFDGEALGKFTNDVLAAASCYPAKLAHGSRFASIKTAIMNEDKEKRANRIARLALSLHSGTAHAGDLDLAGRPELFIGISDRAQHAIGLFNKILDEVYPWSTSSPQSNSANLNDRLETFRIYRRYRDEREGN